MAKPAEHADIPVPPPLIFGVPFVLTVLLLRQRPKIPLPRWVRRVFGALLAAAGFALGGWAVWTFWKAKEDPDVWTPTRSIMRDGPYAYTRNPIYIGMALAYAGLGLVANSLATVTSLPVVLQLCQWFAVEREEAYLRAKFGKRYDRYCDEVPRWLELPLSKP